VTGRLATAASAASSPSSSSGIAPSSALPSSQEGACSSASAALHRTECAHRRIRRSLVLVPVRVVVFALMLLGCVVAFVAENPLPQTGATGRSSVDLPKQPKARFAVNFKGIAITQFSPNEESLKPVLNVGAITFIHVWSRSVEGVIAAGMNDESMTFNNLWRNLKVASVWRERVQPRPRMNVMGRGLPAVSYQRTNREPAIAEVIEAVWNGRSPKVSSQLLLRTLTSDANGLSGGNGRPTSSVGGPASLVERIGEQDRRRDGEDKTSEAREEHQLGPKGHVLLSLKVGLLVLLFLGGIPALCLSILRCGNALEAVCDRIRGARWKCAGWFAAALFSVGISAGALTWAADLLRQS
jgi:hypothetical protein